MPPFGGCSPSSPSAPKEKILLADGGRRRLVGLASIWRLLLHFCSNRKILLADGGRKRLEGLGLVERLQSILSFSNMQFLLADGGRGRLEGLDLAERLQSIFPFSKIQFFLAKGERRRLEGLTSVWRLETILSFSTIQIFTCRWREEEVGGPGLGVKAGDHSLLLHHTNFYLQMEAGSGWRACPQCGGCNPFAPSPVCRLLQAVSLSSLRNISLVHLNASP